MRWLFLYTMKSILLSILTLLFFITSSHAQKVRFVNEKTGRARTFELPCNVTIAFKKDNRKYGFLPTQKVILQDVLSNGDMYFKTHEGKEMTISFKELKYIRMDRTIASGFFYGYLLLCSSVLTVGIPIGAVSMALEPAPIGMGDSQKGFALGLATIYWLPSLPITYFVGRNFNRKFNSQRFFLSGN